MKPVAMRADGDRACADPGTPVETSEGVPAAAPDWTDLFRRLADGERSALAELYAAAGGTIFGLALWRTGSAEDAAEVVQDVFVRLIERRSSLASVSDPRSWLLAVAHHLAADLSRKRRRRSADPIESVPYLVAPEGEPERRIDAFRAAAHLATLAPAQRDAVYLRHFAGCSFRQIGRITGVPTFTAASRCRLGLARLRHRMEKSR